MRMRLLAAAAVGTFFTLALAFPWLKAPAINVASYSLAALGVAVMMRAGQISFGHAMYACIAAYTVAFLGRAFPRLDGVVLVSAGLVTSLAAGAVVGVFIVRYRAIFFGMLNLALSMVLYALISKLYALTGGTDGLRFARPTIAGLRLERAEFETVLLVFAVALALALAWGVQRYFGSANGEALAGIRTNETRLEYLGISARRVLWNGYVLSAGLVGLSGAVSALMQGLVAPEIGYWLRSGEYVFIAILGGAGHALGPVFGALVFELVKMFAAAYLTNVWQMLLGLTLIAAILVAPEGIVGLMRVRARRLGGEA